MLQPKDFRYTLIVDDQEYVLPHAPVGWDENVIRWARSDLYYGLMRSFSLPVKFVLDGAFLIRRKLYSESIQGSVVLRIELLDRNSWQYDVLYENEIDLSTVVDTETSIECSFADSGIESKIKAYENIRYEIDLSNDEEAINVRIPGIDRVGRADLAPFAETANSVNYMIPASAIRGDDMGTQYLQVQPTFQEVGVNPFNFSTSDNWILRGVSSVQNVTIEITLDVREINIESGANTFIRIDSSLGGARSERQIVGNGIHRMTFVRNVAQNERLFLNVFSSTAPGVLIRATPQIVAESSEVTFSYALVTDSSVARSMRPKRLFQKLIERMAGSEVVVKSNILDEWEQLTLTSGDAIRELPSSMIHTSFKDFFKSIDAVLCVGFGIENGVPTIEERAYFFKRGLNMINIGVVKDLELEAYDNYIFNSIKVGYPNKDYEVPNGREEYNSTQIYSTPITRVVKELDATSVYRADQYGIEGIRIDRIDKNIEREDESADNDTFFIYVRPEQTTRNLYDVEGMEAYPIIEGISTRSSSYNLKITPKSNLNRHLNFIYSFLQGVNGSINFESAEKNSLLQTVNLQGDIVVENSNIQIADLGNAMFYPYVVVFTTDLQKNTRSLMSQNTTGFIQFEYRGHQFMGFILETSIDASRNREQEFKLLLSPLNNILNFIH